MVAEQDPRREPRASSVADPTRDIRLPPLPGRPGPELPPEWEKARRSAEAAKAARPVDAPGPHTEVAATAVPPTAVPPTGAPSAAVPAIAPPRTKPPTDEHPTDELRARLASPPDPNRTLTFTGSSQQRWAAGHAATPDPAWSSVPAAPGPVVVEPRSRSRRWPWVVLTLLPVLVIVVTGVWLLILMR